MMLGENKASIESRPIIGRYIELLGRLSIRLTSNEPVNSGFHESGEVHSRA
jgi:hypothetical protein